MAQLYFKYGAMGSSKTANALMTRFNYEERGQKTLLVKPRLDTRDGDHMVVSRIGLTYPCIYFDEMQQLSVMELQQNACVIVDEAQFLTREEVMYLVGLVDDLGIPVICYGLRADFSLQGFPGSTRLLELAHNIEEMKTICQCGRKAMFNGRKLGIPIVAVTDTNCDPDVIDYIIPGNDDAIRAIKLFVTAMAEACLEGEAMRKDSKNKDAEEELKKAADAEAKAEEAPAVEAAAE